MKIYSFRHNGDVMNVIAKWNIKEKNQKAIQCNPNWKAVNSKNVLLRFNETTMVKSKTLLPRIPSHYKVELKNWNMIQEDLKKGLASFQFD